MSSVTQRIAQITQPRGGYIKLSQFETTKLKDWNTLYGEENINPTLVGLTVDYLTRMAMGAKVEDAFDISIKGVRLASRRGRPHAIEEGAKLLSNIQGLDEKSIFCACKLVTFDTWYRDPVHASFIAKTPDDIDPNYSTVCNIKIMVERSVSFWKEYGPIVKDGFTFGEEGYTSTVTAGDGDFLTHDTLWDFKVLKSKPATKHTLQILMYWIMGQHSNKEEFKSIVNIGIFNPRLNEVYVLPISRVDPEIIKTVEKEVICY